MSVLISMTETQQPALRSSARTSSEANPARKCLHFCIVEPCSEGLHSSPLAGRIRIVKFSSVPCQFFRI